MSPTCPPAQDAIERLRRFCWTDPHLPDAATKTFRRDQSPLGLDVTMERADVVARLDSLRDTNELAGLAFYAYRDLNRVEAGPFLKAAWERCPVSIAACAGMSDAEVVAAVRALPEESIYDEPGRLAQPDEVWNYGRGDGAEKAVLLANILNQRHPDTTTHAGSHPRADHPTRRHRDLRVRQQQGPPPSDLGVPDKVAPAPERSER